MTTATPETTPPTPEQEAVHTEVTVTTETPPAPDTTVTAAVAENALVSPETVAEIHDKIDDTAAIAESTAVIVVEEIQPQIQEQKEWQSTVQEQITTMAASIQELAGLMTTLVQALAADSESTPEPAGLPIQQNSPPNEDADALQKTVLPEPEAEVTREVTKEKVAAKKQAKNQRGWV